jgi:hypothetical protein
MRPYRVAGHAVHFPVIACMLMNADFDGDQIAVYPLFGEDAVREARERLSVAGHVRREASVLRWIAPAHEAMWGLADLSRTDEGCARIASALGGAAPCDVRFATRAALASLLGRLLAKVGADATLRRIVTLWRVGLERCRLSGASMNAFLHEAVDTAAAPAADEPWAWGAFHDGIAEDLQAREDFDDARIGPQLLAARSGARGSIWQLVQAAGVGGAIVCSPDGELVSDRTSFGEGKTVDAAFERVVGARTGLARVALAHPQEVRRAYPAPLPAAPAGSGVLARAMRARFPGVVFAHAAKRGEVDPLGDLDARLFVGLP